MIVDERIIIIIIILHLTINAWVLFEFKRCSQVVILETKCLKL